MVLVRSCRRTREIATSQFFNDLATGLGHAIGMVSNAHSNPSYCCGIIVSSVWEKTDWLSWHSFQNGKEVFLTKDINIIYLYLL